MIINIFQLNEKHEINTIIGSPHQIKSSIDAGLQIFRVSIVTAIEPRSGRILCACMRLV